jgi:hypothetical protein
VNSLFPPNSLPGLQQLPGSSLNSESLLSSLGGLPKGSALESILGRMRDPAPNMPGTALPISINFPKR